jgi:hypothetical protein
MVGLLLTLGCLTIPKWLTASDQRTAKYGWLAPVFTRYHQEMGKELP